MSFKFRALKFSIGYAVPIIHEGTSSKILLGSNNSVTTRA